MRASESDAGKRRKSSRKNERSKKPARESKATSQPPADEEQPSEAAEQAPAGEPFMIVLTVIARDGSQMAGPALREAFEAEKLRSGSDNLFHGYGSESSADPVYSILNVKKPGMFPADEMDELQTPGIALVMDADAPREPAAVFDDMLALARRLAEALDARVCDHGRNALTNQAINHLRESIAEQSRRKLLRG